MTGRFEQFVELKSRSYWPPGCGRDWIAVL